VKTRLFTFVNMLRDAGLSLTVGETLDAVHAVRMVGVERRALRDGLAATLLKDEADRPAFDAAFDRCFPLLSKQRGKGQQPEPSGDEGSSGTGKSGAQTRSATPHDHPHAGEPDGRAAIRERTPTVHHVQSSRGRLLHGRKRLLATPFAQMSPRDSEDCEKLVAELAQRFRAHLRRRQRHARHGRLDVRRTIRWSISKGGVPIQPAFRRRRPGAPDLVALCDCSHSVATATRFLIGLLHPAHEFFRRVRLFAFVDQPIEMSVEGGTLVPHERLDLYARSDFGKVLVTFQALHERLLNRNTILLILGDARNNRRPPRADVLARLRYAVRRVVWLNPEPPPRWNSGDSVISTYQRACDELLAASTIQELHSALRRSLSPL
jgi:uncharacterized protein with von Willebrand factor type A (vWA) domain